MSAPALPDDPGALRLALNWFHTWFGLFVGGLLFVIFWTGTLSVFDREIDRWMIPSTRLATAPPVSADAVLAAVRADLADARGWRMLLPDNRTPVVEVQIARRDGERVRRFVDPTTLRPLADTASLGGTGFLYPYHYTLNFGSLGLFLCAFAAVVMVALCVSGVIIHKKIFADFFTLRIVRKPQRTTLDLHNLSGVLTLPFLLVISFTGVAIFTYTYLPSAQSILFGRDPAALAAGYYSRPAADAPGTLAVSLDMVRHKAGAHWAVAPPRYVQLIHPGDANAYFELRPDGARTISKSTAAIWFDAATGKLLAVSPDTPTRRFYDFLYGIHLIQFDHWTLRWLYFLSGLAGCVLIATGLLFWVQSRRKRHEKAGLRGVRVAESISIGVTIGLLLATLGFLAANRLLPPTMAMRGEAEIWTFHALWLAALGQAIVRGRVAWREQSWAIAAGCVLVVVLNAATTSTGVIPAIAQGLWHTAGVDLVLLASAGIAVVAATALDRRMRADRTAEPA